MPTKQNPLVPFRGSFQNFHQSPPSFFYGNPPPPPPLELQVGTVEALYNGQPQVKFTGVLERLPSKEFSIGQNNCVCGLVGRAKKLGHCTCTY